MVEFYFVKDNIKELKIISLIVIFFYLRFDWFVVNILLEWIILINNFSVGMKW